MKLDYVVLKVGQVVFCWLWMISGRLLLVGQNKKFSFG